MSRDERDWWDLPLEMIYLVSQKLTDVRYFIRFCSVCKSWRSAILLFDHPPQIPWLLEYDDNFIAETCLDKELRFNSLADAGRETRVFSIPINHSRSDKYYKTSNGCLLMIDGRNLSLLNPLTNKTISLPSLPSAVWPFSFRHFFINSDLIQAGSIYLGCDHGNWNCGICHPDKMEWKCMDVDSFKTCYLNGMLFTSLESDYTKVLDAASGKKLYEVEGPNYREGVVVESCGVILRLSILYISDIHYIFGVYKLNFEGEGQPSWVKANNIRDQILFLDFKNSFTVRATVGFKENNIYYILNKYVDQVSTLWRYDIATGKAERLHCPFKPLIWFIPKSC